MPRNLTNRLRRVLLSLSALTLAGCVARVQDDEASDRDSASRESGELRGEESSSETGAESVACRPEDRVPDFEVASAWRERDETGTDGLRVYLQSFDSRCSRSDEGVTVGHTIIRMWIPLGDELPARFELQEVGATALIAPGGPGSDGPNNEIAWLRGELLVDLIDDHRVVATLRDEPRFEGCFEAVMCDE